MKLNSLVDLTTFRPLRWAAPRCHLDVTGRMPPRVPANCQAWLDPSSLRSTVRCVLLSVSINLKAPTGRPPPLWCATTLRNQADAMCIFAAHAYHTETRVQSFCHPHTQKSFLTLPPAALFS